MSAPNPKTVNPDDYTEASTKNGLDNRPIYTLSQAVADGFFYDYDEDPDLNISASYLGDRYTAVELFKILIEHYFNNSSSTSVPPLSDLSSINDLSDAIREFANRARDNGFFLSCYAKNVLAEPVEYHFNFTPGDDVYNWVCDKEFSVASYYSTYANNSFHVPVNNKFYISIDGGEEYRVGLADYSEMNGALHMTFSEVPSDIYPSGYACFSLIDLGNTAQIFDPED